MRKLICTIFLLSVFSQIHAQAFEGVLQIDYRNEKGSRNAVDVYVKGDSFFMKRLYGGCDRYDSYIYDARAHALSCLSPQSPKTALSMDISKVLDIYETKNLKPGYHIHMPQDYTETGSTKKIEGLRAAQKKASDTAASYEIWTTDIKVNFGELMPVLRMVGFWGDAEDSSNVILESKTVNLKTKKSTSVAVLPIKKKVDNSLFVIPQDYQQVDLDKFLVNEYKSPRYGDLVKAFTGF